MRQSRKKRLALVTGGCTGIGFAIASGLEEAGCRVTVTGVDSNDLNRLDVVESGFKARCFDITVNLARTTSRLDMTMRIRKSKCVDCILQPLG